MAQIVSHKWVRGLNLNSNPYVYTPGKDPYGGASNACLIADECILTRARMVGNRKGFDYHQKNTPAPVDAMFEYQSQMIEHQSDATMWYADPVTGSRSQLSGTYTALPNHRVEASVARGSLFFTSTAGIWKMDAYNTTPIRAGLTKGLDTRVTSVGTGSGFMGGFTKCAYRISWRRTDAQNQLIRSDVSNSVVATNATRQTLVSLTSATGTATATTPLAHGYSSGDLVLISGAVQTQYNGNFTITSTGTTTFTYVVSGSPATPATTTTALTCEKAMNVSIATTVPWDVGVNDYVEIWRTVTKDAGTPDPGDEMYLVSAVKNAVAAGGVYTYVDSTPDAVITSNTALYTNSTQEGITQNNGRPPVCYTLVNYKDYELYGCTAIDHQQNLTMLASVSFVNGTTRFIINDSTGSRTYTAQAAENTATQSFQLYTGGASPSFNIEMTTRSLIHVINCDSGGRWYAEYTSSATSSPGGLRIWARSPLTGAFWLTCDSTTTGNQFLPTIPTSGTTQISSNDQRNNRLYYSKVSQPECVPSLNYIDVGRSDQKILRLVAIRDAAFVISEGGVYFLSGLTAPFTLVELDSTCRCVAEATVRMHNNTVLMLSNQGVVGISLSGVTVISVDIEPVIMQQALLLPNLATVAFATAHESARHYYLFLPTTPSDTVATQAYVYHSVQQEWCRWRKKGRIGIVLNSNYTLYLSSGLESCVLKQRNSGDQTDFSDEEQPITVVSQTNSTVSLTWANTLFVPTAGVSLHQGGAVAKVLSVTQTSPTAWQMVIDRNTVFSPGAATARMPIYAHLRLSPNVLGEAGLVKTIYGVSYLMQYNTVSTATIELATNEAPILNTYTISRSLSGGWGASHWGMTAWGDVVSEVQDIPFMVDCPIPDMTGEAVNTGWLHNVSQEQFILAQVSIIWDQLVELEVTA